MNRKITFAGDEWDPEDHADGYTEWEEVKSKPVLDYDGFYTDYTMWYNQFEDKYVFTFGDKDIYYPENADWDWECENRSEADEWFDDYVGPGEENEDIYSSSKINSSTDSDWTNLSAADQTAVEYAADFIRNGVNPTSAVYRACETVGGGNAEPEYEDEDFYQDEPNVDAVMRYVLKHYGDASSSKNTDKECVTASYNYATDIVQDMYHKFPKINFVDEEPDNNDPSKIRLYFDASKWPADIEKCCDYLNSKGIENYLNDFTIVIVSDNDEDVESCDDMKKAKITASTEDLRNKIINKVDEEVIMLEENIMHDVAAAIPEYNPDWCAEDLQFSYEDAREAFINSMVDDILLQYSDKF